MKRRQRFAERALQQAFVDGLNRHHCETMEGLKQVIGSIAELEEKITLLTERVEILKRASAVEQISLFQDAA